MRAYLSTILTATALLGSAVAHANIHPPQLPQGLKSLMAYEQQVNRNIDETRVTALTNNQNRQFSPEGGQWFQVKSYWVEADLVHTFTSQTELSKSFISKSGKDAYVLFLVHPESEDFYKDFLKSKKSGPHFFALATSSSRTVLVSPEGRPDLFFFAKLSLNKEIGGVVRTIPKGEIARSVGTTNALIGSQSYFERSFDFLPESVGVMPKGMDRGGFLIREIPADVLSGQSELMPMFSLFTRQQATGKSPFALMIKKTGQKPLSFIKEELLRPFARLWLDLVINHGVAIEAHGQNFLVEVQDGLPTGKFVFRDFGGFNLDLEFRTDRIFPKVDLPIVTNVAEDYHQKHHANAIRQSLYNYFEAGVLYGLAEEASHLQPGISYKQLGFEFRKVLAEEAGAYRISIDPNDATYFWLNKEISKARSKHQSKALPRCERLFVSFK